MDSHPNDPARRAAGAILNRLDELSDSVAQSVWNRVPSYSAVLLDRDDLHAYVLGNVDAVFSALRDDSAVDADFLVKAHELGERRALQGVPLEALMRSFRSAERAMVEHFTRFYAMFADDFSGQRAGVAKVLESLDRIEQETIDAYQGTQLRLAFHSDPTGNVVGKLAAGDEVSTADLEQLAVHHHVDPNQPHVAVVARVVREEDRLAAGQIRHYLTARLLETVQRPVLTGEVRDAMVFLTPVVGAEILVIRQGLTRALHPNHCRYDVLVGMGTASDSLTSVGPSCRQALDVVAAGLRLGRHRQVLQYDELLVDIILCQDPEVSDRLVSVALAPIEGQEHLLSTLAAYFDADQSTPETARALVVHQNTVVYRLRRVKELTGLDVRVTDDLVKLRLAMRARALASHSLSH